LLEPAITTLPETSTTFAVIESPPLLVAQNMVSFSDKFEDLFGYWVTRVTVWVIPKSKLPKAFLSILKRSIPGESKNFIIVATGLYH
jgi:hypothetical protein